MATQAHNEASAHTNGLPADLYGRIRRVLRSCACFASDRSLRALFVDPCLAPWRDVLPEADSPAGRVTQTLAFLANRYAETHENALVCLLHVLAEQTPEGDAARGQLAELAGELERALKGKIFLCYKRGADPDERLALFLHEALAAEGYAVFIDQTLRAGVDWLAELDRQIRESAYLIALLSPASADSEMVQSELRQAYEYRHAYGHPQTLPIRIAYDGPLPYTLGFFLNPFQYTTWETDADTGTLLGDVLAALRGQLPDRAPQPAPSPAPGAAIPEDGRGAVDAREPASPLPAFDPRVLKSLTAPGGAELRDTFYIAREADARLARAVTLGGATVTIRAPRQSGKTSLLVRGVKAAGAQGQRVIYLDLQRFAEAQRGSLDDFLYAFALEICDELDVDPAPLVQRWQSPRGAPQKMTRFMQRHVLHTGEPVLLALDEADCLLNTTFYRDVFSLLRSWHNLRPFKPQWEPFSLILVISTEPYLLIDDLNQSPFNVGEDLALADFSLAQMHDLNRRHGAPLREEDVTALWELMGGQPFLTRQALYTLVIHKLDWPTLSAAASDEDGPFGSHLRHLYWAVREKPRLQQALRQVVLGEACGDDLAVFRLLKAGLIKQAAGAVVCRCALYQRYFADKL